MNDYTILYLSREIDGTTARAVTYASFGEALTEAITLADDATIAGVYLVSIETGRVRTITSDTLDRSQALAPRGGGYSVRTIARQQGVIMQSSHLTYRSAALAARSRIAGEYRCQTPFGNIVSPGAFEGHPLYVAYLWEQVLEGYVDDTLQDGDTTVCVFDPESDTRDVFGMPDDKVFLVWQGDYGHIYCRPVTAAEYAEFEEECIANSENEESELSPFRCTTSEPFSCLQATHEGASQ